jgi:hypothetical protein
MIYRVPVHRGTGTFSLYYLHQSMGTYSKPIVL